tara:strand:+ start:236 stop:415 length:180 start_codon:yes stop_codon:yes gene_type:complete
MPGYDGQEGTVVTSTGSVMQQFQNRNNNASMLDLSGKMNIALVLLVILVVMCGYTCFKK